MTELRKQLQEVQKAKTLMRNRVRKKILKAKIVDTQQKSGYAKVSEGT